MKIEDHRVSAKFGDIKDGECFEYEGDIYMKVVGRINDAATSNVVDLVYGVLMTLDNDEVVWRVDAKAVID